MQYFNFHKAKRRQKGFTIIEAVVSAGVFAFIVSSILGVYMATIQLDSKTRAERAVQQNARFIMDFLSKEIRNGSINYTLVNDADSLNLINQLDEEELIQWDGSSNLVLTKTGLGSTQLNSNGVRITNFAFYTAPTRNPFILANDVHVQPHVTIVMRLEYESTNRQADNAYMDIQSTFTVRDYPSRL